MNAPVLADAILAFHLFFVLFVAGGFALILAGGALGWRWVRWRPLRWTHLGAIVLVALESLAGLACPLTVWEDALRHSAPAGGSFLGRWIARVLYYDFPDWVFTVSYAAFALAVAAAWRLVPPRPRAGGATPPR